MHFVHYQNFKFGYKKLQKNIFSAYFSQTNINIEDLFRKEMKHNFFFLKMYQLNAFCTLLKL